MLVYCITKVNVNTCKFVWLKKTSPNVLQKYLQDNWSQNLLYKTLVFVV